MTRKLGRWERSIRQYVPVGGVYDYGRGVEGSFRDSSRLLGVLGGRQVLYLSTSLYTNSGRQYEEVLKAMSLNHSHVDNRSLYRA
jgi:hypothetical protein